MPSNKIQYVFLNVMFTVPSLWEPNDKCSMGTQYVYFIQIIAVNVYYWKCNST